MQDLEESMRSIDTYKLKLKDLGDSLWHSKARSRIKRIRR